MAMKTVEEPDAIFYHFPPSANHAWTGTRYIDLLDPDPKDIHLPDIARALCGMRRFNRYGTTRPWSVGQHSLLVLHLATFEGETDIASLLAALLHDAPEAYLGDMVRPLKLAMPQFCEVDDWMWGVMACKWRIPGGLIKGVKPYDDQALAMERAEMVAPEAGLWWGLSEVKGTIPQFLYDLTDEECEVEFLEAAHALFELHEAA